MALNKVVLKYKDGKLLKGCTSDFSPRNAVFHLIPLGAEDESSSTIEVVVDGLKAIFFVRDFAGDLGRTDEPADVDDISLKRGEKLIEVRFHDGEFLSGVAQCFHLDRPGFFMVPADPGSNNERIYVVISDLVELTVDGKTIPVDELKRFRRHCPTCNSPAEFTWRWCPYDGTRLGLEQE